MTHSTQPRLNALDTPPSSVGRIKLAVIAAIAGVFLIAGAGALAQATPSGDSKPAQKTPAKPGVQAGDAPAQARPQGGSTSTGQLGTSRSGDSAGAAGAEKTPAKPGAQSGKEPSK